jgi:hypothetical protein
VDADDHLAAPRRDTASCLIGVYAMTTTTMPREGAAAPGPASAGPIVTVDHLRKTYGPGVGVQDVSFRVERREIFGIIGPNGAGKTTTVECICGLRVPDSGMIEVLGLDPRVHRSAIRGAGRSPAPGKRAAAVHQGRRGHGTVRLVLPAAGRPGRAAGGPGTDRQAQHLLPAAVRGPEAAAVDRPGADRQPGGSPPPPRRRRRCWPPRSSSTSRWP